jgi:S1-C subfamily serine protease
MKLRVPLRAEETRMKGRAWIFGCLIVMAVGVVLGRGFFRGPSTAPVAGPGSEEAPVPAQEPPGNVEAPPAPASPLPEGLGPEERRDIEVFRRASASVVFITSIALRRDLWSFDVMQIPQGTGSGFVWDKKGHIVTNFHVIESGDKLAVTLGDRSEWEADVVGTAPDKDLAVLRIAAPADRLVPLTAGRSHDLLVGQKVLALGNPFGLDHSMTSGIVSALGRELKSPNGRTIRDVIQTDAAINPGNSGGPLLDSAGRLIGVNAAIFSPSGASAGIGFAVPVDTVKRLVPQLIEKGRAVNPGIGVTLLSDAQASQFGLEGVVILSVVAGGPADRAGIEGIGRSRRGYVVGDSVVAVDGKPVKVTDDLAYAFETAGVGRSVTLTLERQGRKRDATVTLADIR